MRVILDTNIFISYLLSRKEETINKVVEAAFFRKFTLIVPDDLLEELIEKTVHKKYLNDKIKREDLKRLMGTLTVIAQISTHINSKTPFVTRDQKDDYLVACAVTEKVDYLVSGDKDLLSLKKIGSVKIISPKNLLKIINKEKKKIKNLKSYRQKN